MIEIEYKILWMYVIGLGLLGLTSAFITVSDSKQETTLSQKIMFILFSGPFITILSPIFVHFVFWKSIEKAWEKTQKSQLLKHLKK